MLAWNNPKLHTPERRKTWLACEEHREHLSQFLGVRGFLKDVVRLEEWETPEELSAALAQPPIADIGRSGWTKDGSSRPAPAFLPHIASRQMRAISSSGASERRAARRSVSSRAKRQVRIWPSAVSRVRSQARAERAGDGGDDADAVRAAVDQPALGGGRTALVGALLGQRRSGCAGRRGCHRR